MCREMGEQIKDAEMKMNQVLSQASLKCSSLSFGIIVPDFF